MTILRYLLLLAPVLLLTACGLSPQQKADYAAVQSSGVSPAIYDKMLHDDDLGISDVESLSRAHVNSAVILRYMRDHATIYRLSSADVTALQKAGTDPSVIDYMLQSAENAYGGGSGYPYGPYGGYYWGGPFFYGPGFYPAYFYGGYHGRR